MESKIAYAGETYRVNMECLGVSVVQNERTGEIAFLRTDILKRVISEGGSYIDDRPTPEEPEGEKEEWRNCQRCGDVIPWHDKAIGYCAGCYDALDTEGNETDPFPPLAAEASSDTPTDRARDAALREVNREYDSFDEGITPPKVPELVRQLLESIAKEDGL